MNGNSVKWACDYCTFENWPVSKKCTLCRAPRPLQLIKQDGEFPPQDIYKIAPLICATPEEVNNSSNVISDNNDPTGATSSMSPHSGSGSKWSCHVCTYLNWPRSHKCTQCLTPQHRTRISPNTSSETSLCNVQQVTNVNTKQASNMDHMTPLSINVNANERLPTALSRRNSRQSPNSPEINKELNNDLNRAIAAASVKWNCKSCTYENWPKSVRCILCGKSRSPNSGRKNSSPFGSNSNINISPTQGSLISDIMASNQNASLANRSRTTRQMPSPKGSVSNEIIEGATAATTSSAGLSNIQFERYNRADDRRVKQIRNRMSSQDWLWINACIGVVEGDPHAVEAYIIGGGDPARSLTEDEVIVLNRPSAFASGYTLIHLAIRFSREDILTVLLASTDVVQSRKCVPSHVSPGLASEILRDISASIRQRKGDFPCYFLSECASFILPADIEDLPMPIQKQLFDELLDRDVQKELESEETIINWNIEVTGRLSSRLYALWNRTAGDCLLDSVLQSTWGIFDRDNTLRRALGDSLSEGACSFYPRWKEYESMQAQSLHFSLDENQWQHDWAILLSIASQPGAALEQSHIFALAHILRRPIIVYGVKFIKSFRGETIGFARFQGVYLPLLWEQSFCWKTPITLGYTRGHFSALVAMESDMDENIGAGANVDNSDTPQTVYLPLTDSEGKLLPIHFLVGSEIGKEESILREWLDCCMTDGGLLVAQLKVSKRSSLVKHMLDEWLDRYRRLAHVVQSTSDTQTHISSDGETDDE